MNNAEHFNKLASEADNQDDRVWYQLKAIYFLLGEILDKTGSYT